MPRTYKPDPRGKTYNKYDEEQRNRAIADIKDGLSYKLASKKHEIPVGVLHRWFQKKCNGKTVEVKKQGGQTVLSLQEESLLVDKLLILAEWGYPLTTLDLRLVVKDYLDKKGVDVCRFKDNMPGVEWGNSFLKRHNGELSKRLCENLKQSRSQLSPELVEEYFSNLKTTLEGIPPSNIINYDETNLSDDPGRRKAIVKRGSKHPERIMNSSKSSISVMYAASADGQLLPPYICYKAVNLYKEWTVGGPRNTRYNRSKSGWFDSITFEDWFSNTLLPYARKLPGRKLVIGDNLSSHLTISVIEKCEQENIAFAFLPPNSTHKTQPLDVAVFKPMKTAWKNILEKFKKGEGSNSSSIPKTMFPTLLKEFHDEISVGTV